VFELYLGSGIVVFVSAAVLFGLAQITLHRQVTAGQLGRLAVNYLVFALCVLAISNIISSLTRNRAAISAISTVFSLGLSFISGAFLPQELVSESVLRVSKAFRCSTLSAQIATHSLGKIWFQTS
jgi:ABC-2 type transport system permease protein